MHARLSSKGQIVLPGPIRRKLGLQPGDELDATIEGLKIVLVPRHSRAVKSAIVRDALTGLPVLSAGPGAPRLTSGQVMEILSDFP
jgi:AbrB family looped-hinge helix DNA binding protein